MLIRRIARPMLASVFVYAGIDSLRNPQKRAEMAACTEVLADFVTLYPQAEVWAIGRVSEQKLHQLGIRARYIRHPSHGGKSAFVRGVSALPHGGR